MLWIPIIVVLWAGMGAFMAQQMDQRINLWTLFWCGGLGFLCAAAAGIGVFLLMKLWWIILPLVFIGSLIYHKWLKK